MRINREWWSEPGWVWLQGEEVAEPSYWRDWRWNAPNQPVVGVGFWEAEACCAWAGGRLPREQEWEAAARGPEGCVYPWCGDWEDGICNSLETGLHVTLPVGLFPRSRQARLGLEDLSGNVWEWCSCTYEDSDNVESHGLRYLSRVWRGGSWNGSQDDARCASRYEFPPFFRNYVVGFRVVCSSPIVEL